MDPRIYRQLHEIEESHWWFRGRRRIVAATFERFGIRGRAILDVGCGAGTNLDLLRTINPGSAIVGIDIEHEPLRLCSLGRSVPVSQADVAQLPFAASAFDVITALDTLEHVRDDARVLAELFRVCRPGGAVVLTVPAFPWLWGTVDELGHHYRRYRKPELLERVTGAGFSVRVIRFFNYLLFPPIALVRLLGRLIPDGDSADARSVHSDFDIVKRGPANTLLARIFSLEASLLGFRPPFGVSLLCVAVRER